VKYYYSYLMLTDTSNQLPISFIHIVTVLPLKLMFLNYCNFSRHYISCSNQTLSNKMPYCRRHELVALTLISIKFVLTTHSFDLLMLQKSACSFLKLILIRKILSVLQLRKRLVNVACPGTKGVLPDDLPYRTGVRGFSLDSLASLVFNSTNHFI